MIFGYEYRWQDRITLWEAAPLAETSNWFETILTKLGIPEIMLVLGLGFIVYFALEALGQRSIGRMTILVAIFSSVAILAENLKRLFG